jgi:branched-chain amino acid transport system permease protein
MKRNRIYIIITVLAIIAFGTVPFYINVDSFFAYYLFICFIYITLAQGWNLVAGYTGQISLGTHAFFALGAYTTAIIWLHDITKTWYYFDPLVMVLSGLVSVVFAIIIGIPTLSRLRGVFFRYPGGSRGSQDSYFEGGQIYRGSHGFASPGHWFHNHAPLLLDSPSFGPLGDGCGLFHHQVKHRAGSQGHQ